MHYRIAQIDFLKRYNFTKTWFGRRRTFSAYPYSRGKDRAEIERKALNHPIQGSAADVLKIAIARVQHQIDTDKWSSTKPRMVLNVHDEIVLEVNEWDVRKAARMCLGMTKDILPIKLPVEVSYGPNWEDQEEWV